MSSDRALVVLAGIYTAGIALGLLLAALLAVGDAGNRTANRCLAAATSALALLTFGTLLEDTRLVLEYPHLGHVSDWLIFTVGPWVWLYVRRLTGEARPSGWRLVAHFGPAIGIVLLFAPFYLMDANAKRVALAAELAAPPEVPNVVLLLAAAQILAYLSLAIITLHRYEQRLTEQYSSVERRSFRWLRTMLLVCLALWVVWVIGEVFGVEAVRLPNALSVPLAFYVLAFLGLRQPAVFVDLGQAAGSGVPPPAPTSARAAAKYRHSNLDEARVAEYRARLEALMATEKPWLENDLTLADLAARVGISPHQLSQLLNAHVGRTFFDFVNERRVREVQRCLRDPAYDHQSIIEIALAAGFNSKTAFNAAFRLHAGTTPRDYRSSRPER